ncbi:MAG TPA: protein kinase [Blastocatellia bacterium]|nr:protein kinase [Blastocatellia bacterium]
MENPHPLKEQGNQKATLSPGNRLGAYEIVSHLGTGGMGQVFRARDTRLGRDIAIKVLSGIFPTDPEQLARLDREARVLATLNHPNIATIHGIEDVEGIRAIVLELVEGETLAERVRRGPVSLREALSISTQIAAALEAAHEKGIIHRDLKPANIKITPSEVVKVLDFGLARMIPDKSMMESEAETQSLLTEPGLIVGTVPYMSPEQARGRAIDKRTDIWAFGCVLYELLSGQRAFSGETLSDTLAAILEREPAWDRLPRATPSNVGNLLRRCLNKDHKRRLRDIGDAQFELEQSMTAQLSEDRTSHKPAMMTRRTAIGALLGAAAGGATGIAVSRYYRDGTPRSLSRFSMVMTNGDIFTASFNKRVAISPDGTYLACNIVPQGNQGNLLIRSLRELDFKLAFEGARGGGPFFSPDGKWLAFAPLFEGSQGLRKVALSGGAPVNICSAGSFQGGTWADDDAIYFVATAPGGLLRVPAGGGEPVEAVPVEFDKGERSHRFPHALPGGKGVLLTIATNDSESFDDAHIAVSSPRSGMRKVLVEGGFCPSYSRSGHLVYARNGNLFAIRFDADGLAVIGQPYPVLEGVLMSRNTGVANFDLSATGDLAYIPGKAVGGARTLFWVDRKGQSEQVPLPARSYLHPRLSPDAGRLAIEIEGSSHDVYLYDFRSGVLSNITTDGVSHWPIWSPDGQWIGYRSGPMGHFQLWQVPADRSRPAERIQAEGPSQNAESYSPDGRAIVYTISAPGAPGKIAVVSLKGDGQAQPLDTTKYAQGSAKFSPDGRWLSYCSNESGKPQVYVQAFPGPGPKTQVSIDGGTDPVWKRTGGELFYRNGESMMTVAVVTEPTFSAGRPQELWKGSYSHGMSSSCGAPGLTSSNYDVSADGQRFLMVRDDDVQSERSSQIVLVQAWAGELGRLSA